jgi:hypothetical protein
MSRSLTDFFSSPNEISIAELTTSQAELLSDLVDLGEEASLRRTVLPARSAGITRWYGFASSRTDERLLLEELRSWIGPPVGSRLRQVAAGSSDLLDIHALEIAGDRRIVVATISEDHRESAQAALRGLSQMWALLPTRVRAPDRPVGRVLRDFYQALLAGSRPIAEAALEEVTSRGLLSSTNVRFLLVDLINAVGTAAEMRSDKRLVDLALLVRPPRVTESLARAADELFFHWDGALGPTEVERISSDLENCWPGLVVSATQVRSRATARCLAAVESIASAPRRSVLDFLATGPWSDDAFVAAVVGTHSAVGLVQHESAYEYLIAGELDQALSRAISSGNPDDLTVAVFAAFELGTDEAARIALVAIDGQDSGIGLMAADNPVVARRIAALRERLDAHEEAGDWCQWLQQLDAADVVRPDRLRDWSTRLSREPMADPVYVDKLTSALFDALNDGRRSNVRNVLPLIVESFYADGELALQCVGAAVLTVQVTLASDAGAAERALVLTLADQILECGCTASEYSDLVEALSEHVAVIGSRSADFIADAVSLVVDGPALEDDVRANFYAKAAAAVTSMVDRLDPMEAVVLQRALASAGVALNLPLSAVEGDSDGSATTAGIVMIYSLAESTARRAADWIAAAHPDVEIKFSSDKVNSDRLVATVRSAAAVFVHTSKATHAATNAISAAASEKNQIVWVNGRGASSIFRAFLSWADS